MEFPASNVTVTLDKPRVMVINANTMAAYERSTGKFFLDTVMRLFEAMALERRDDKSTPATIAAVLRTVGMEDLRALAWASIHEYDAADEPSWPLTVNQVGRFITPGTVLPIFTAFLTGYVSNSPTKENLGESPAALAKKTTTAESSTKMPAAENPESQSTQPDGGTPGSAVPAGAFD